MSVCPIRHPLWSSVSCDSQGNIVQGSFPHKCGQKNSCSAFNAVVVAFHWIYLGFFSSLGVHDTRPYHWSFLESHIDCWNTYLSCTYHIQRDVPPRTTFPFVPCSLSLGFEPFIIFRSSSDYSRSRPKPKAQYMIWALSPTIAPKNSGFFLSFEKKIGVLNF